MKKPLRSLTGKSPKRSFSEMEFEIRDGRVFLTFGKHKGESLDQVPSDYLLWIIRNADRKWSDEFLVEVEEELRARGYGIEELI